MDMIHFAYILLECAHIQFHRLPNNVDISLDRRRSENQHFFMFKYYSSLICFLSFTSDIITIVLILCSEIIRQKSDIVSSNGSCVIINDSE